MNLQVFHNGIDVTSSIEFQSCILTDRYGGLLDNIRLVVNDEEKVWENKLSKGDEIIVKTDGYTTGTMYISNIGEETKSIPIDAISLKPSKKIVKSRIWRYVRLSEILNDCAKAMNLTLKTYGISDLYYETLAQIHKTDLEFVSYVCKREGYTIKVDDNSLIVFNEYYMESQKPTIIITPDDIESNYRFARSDNCINSVTVSYYDINNGLIEQTATDDNILGGSVIINERVISFDEAIRFAKGYLRDLNKNSIVGNMSMPYNPKISAGTIFTAEGFNKFDDTYIVYEVSHNIKREKSSLKVRKILNY